MPDIQVRLGSSLVQHGRVNDRVYLMQLDGRDMPGLLQALDDLARERRYGKIFAKVPHRHRTAFAATGYVTEALVPGFFRGEEDGHFMSKYLQQDRARPRRRETAEQVLKLARARAARRQGRDEIPDHQLTVRRCVPQDANAMARLYRQVFPSYPFPIEDPEFLRESMAGSTTFVGVWHRRQLIALASAEAHGTAQHAEMTDFATHPSFRGRGLASLLLPLIERQACLRGVVTAYTIARAVSPGMNITFARSGYRYAGRLINNTQISGQIESMNVWYKRLVEAPALAQ